MLKAILAEHSKNIFMGQDSEAMGLQRGQMLLFWVPWMVSPASELHSSPNHLRFSLATRDDPKQAK